MASLSGEGGGRLAKQEERIAAWWPTRGASGWRKWALPLAAGLFLAVLGVSGWQRVEMERQQEEIAKIAGHLREVNLQSGELERYQQELVEAQAKLSVLAASGVEVCSLYPMEEPTGRSAADGDAVRGTRPSTLVPTHRRARAEPRGSGLPALVHHRRGLPGQRGDLRSQTWIPNRADFHDHAWRHHCGQHHSGATWRFS